MARRIDKLQINALNAGNNQILVAREGELAFDDASNIFVGGATDAGFANVALEANIANLVLSIDNFTTDNLNEGSANLYFTNARVLDALTSATIGGNLSVEGSVSANSFVSTSFGIPTIESATNIVLSANSDNGGAVVIQNSPLRLRSYTEGGIANLTASAGDIVFNSSISKAQIYDGTNWANVDGAINTGAQGGSSVNLITTSFFEGPLSLNPSVIPRWYPCRDITIHKSVARVINPGTDTVTFDVKNSENTQYSVSVVGTAVTETLTPINMLSNDYITVEITATGVGAQNLYVTFLYSENV